MSDDTDKTDESQENEENEEKESSDEGDGRVTDAETSFEEYTGDKECPECGEPVIDVRANCPNCGYEYKDDDYADKEAGSEFVAGSAVDDEGNEIPDDETGGGDEVGEEASDEDEDKDDDEDSDKDGSDDG